MATGTARVLGVPIACVTEEQTLSLVEQFALEDRGTPRLVTYANPHCLLVAGSDPAYRNVLSSADLVYADGIGVVWASRLGRDPCPERVTASDFLVPLAHRSAARGIGWFLLGGHPGIADAMAARLQAAEPGLSIRGSQHGFFGAEEDERVVAAINASGAKLLLLGMSVPRQELWAARHLARLGVGVCFCVGGAFDFYSGRMRRAPSWVQRAHLEWAFRLALEPRRMWRRYLVGNAVFAARVLAERLR